MDFDDWPDTDACPECGGTGTFMGSLGRSEWFRCRDCGHEYAGEEYRADLEDQA